MGAEMNKELERLALEVARSQRTRLNYDADVIDFATRFLSAVDAERGKEAVGDVSGNDYSTALLYRDYPPGTPVFLAPQPAIPEGMALVAQLYQYWMDDANPVELVGFRLKVEAMIAAAGVTP